MESILIELRSALQEHLQQLRHMAAGLFGLKPRDEECDGRASFPMTPDRFLHFSNIDMEQPDISSECSRCGQECRADPKPGERVDDVLLRIRAEFEEHTCSAKTLT